jgi:transcriptional regulator with XRE-family HTH domain
LDSNQLQMDRMLSAQQVRAARGLLGWSRRELAIVAGVSQGTIKAIEQGTTDVRLSTLRKLARTFTAHAVEFVADGSRSGVVIKNRVDSGRAQPPRSAPRPKPVADFSGDAEGAEQSRVTNDIELGGNEPSPKATGFKWLRPLVRAAPAQKR